MTNRYANYQQTYRKQRWDSVLNSGLGRIGDDVDNLFDKQGELETAQIGLNNLVTNWAITETYLVAFNSTVTYSSDTEFTIDGDFTTKFLPGGLVHAYCGVDGMVYSPVASAVYALGVTTVTVDDAVLTANLEKVYVEAVRDGLYPGPLGWVIATDYGLPGWQTLQDVVAAIGLAEKTLVFPPGTWEVDDDITVPDNITPVLLRGAVFEVADTKTLTMPSPDAGRYQIFDCQGTGAVVLTGGDAYPEWWGAAGDGVTDDTAAVQAAFDSGTKTILLDNATYLVSGIIYTPGQFLRGIGESSILKMSAASGFVVSKGPAPTYSMVRSLFERFTIDMDSKGDWGLVLESQSYCRIDNVRVLNVPAGTFSYTDRAGGANTYPKAGITIKGQVGIGGAFYNEIIGCYVAGLNVSNYGESGILLTSTTPVSLARANFATLRNNIIRHVEKGVYNQNAGDADIDHVDVTRCTHGVWIGNGQIGTPPELDYSNRPKIKNLYAEFTEVPVVIERGVVGGTVSNFCSFASAINSVGLWILNRSGTFESGTAELGSFIDGETITGLTSGASGKLMQFRDYAGREILWLRNVSGGPFTSLETVQGGTSGATGVVYALNYNPSTINYGQNVQEYNITYRGFNFCKWGIENLDGISFRDNASGGQHNFINHASTRTTNYLKLRSYNAAKTELLDRAYINGAVDIGTLTLVNGQCNLSLGNNKFLAATTNGAAGTVTLDNGGGTTTVVNNTQVTASSLIFLQATSANAAAAVGDAVGVYISARAAGTSFTITHPASPGASATMNYFIVN